MDEKITDEIVRNAEESTETVEENFPVEEKAELVEVDKTEIVPSGVPQQQTNSNVPNGDGESGKLGLESKKPVYGKGPNCKLKDDPIEYKVALTSVSEVSIKEENLDAKVTLMKGTPVVSKKIWKVGTAKGSQKPRKSLEEERSESREGSKENTLS